MSVQSSSGRVYRGQWVGDAVCGYGETRWLDGRIHTGYWVEGAAEGQGKLENGAYVCCFICGIYVVYMWCICGIYVVYMWCICLVNLRTVRMCVCVCDFMCKYKCHQICHRIYSISVCVCLIMCSES